MHSESVSLPVIHIDPQETRHRAKPDRPKGRCRRMLIALEAGKRGCFPWNGCTP